MEIQPIPKIPQKIIEAVDNDKLAVFIGAGVSRLIGCKGWDQLAQNLVEKCLFNFIKACLKNTRESR
ncbi:MAG: hypothetical protein N2053_11510 [Chitinispirillaceae bacterium]|nr:hypothetical protein [Chitinispirillaceae bacterium]